MKFQKIKEAINKEFPDFNIFSVAKIGEGWDSKAFIINETWIFRFPKRLEVKNNLKKEALLLPAIQNLLNLAIPTFEYISNTNIFAGYKKLEGSFFNKEFFIYLSGTEQEIILKQIADFLLTMHHLDLKELQHVALEEINYKENYEAGFMEVQEIIYPSLSTDFQQIITDSYNSYLNNRKNFTYKKSLLHNDISCNHILYNEPKKVLTGIIDFGDIAIGDPDYDLMYLYDELGQQFVKRLLKYYPQVDTGKLFAKLKFFQLADALQSIIHNMKEHKINKIDKGFKLLSELLKTYDEQEKAGLVT